MDAPIKLIDTSLIQLWHKQDTTFLVPKTDVFLCFRNSVLNEGVKSWVMSVLFVDLLQDTLNAYSYNAAITGLSFNVNLYESRIEVYLKKFGGD
jgi:insulysin